MFCPDCHDEYRAGIVRCAACQVDLVEELGDGEPAAPQPEGVDAASAAERLVEYCGFLSLEDARRARDTLRRERVPYEIVIRDAVTDDPRSTPPEEFWLRVPVRHVRRVAELLGVDDDEAPAAESDDQALACSDCGREVGADESFCPHCGARFDE